MKKILIYTSLCNKSSKLLAEALNTRSHGECKARVVNPYTQVVNPQKDEIIFGYGCSSSNNSAHKHVRINTRTAVKNCVDKPTTFKLMTEAGVPTVEYVTKYDDIPHHWDIIVARKKRAGRKAEDLEYLFQDNKHKIPDGELYSEYFPHKYEYRIVVFKNVIVGRYFKNEQNGEWLFNNQPAKRFELMDKACITAAKALGIDYVGFDVVANTKTDFRLLEANSGPVITDEAEDAIIEYFLNLEN